MRIFKEWADKYKGKFDDGWDAYRERVFKRAKQKRWIPQDAELTPRDPTMAAWHDIPEDEKPFQRRLMEIAAGFAEHVDVQVGRLVDEIERLGYGDNTIIFYIWGDNGSSAEGQNGTISELLTQNGIPTTVSQHIRALDQIGGLDVLGSPLTDNQYHAGWAWAGSTPYKGTKLLASHFGGTRNPMAVRWPAKIKPDPVPRSQFHHCNDIVPTVYEILGITPPRRSMVFSRIRSTASALPIASTMRRPQANCIRSTSKSWGAVPSTTTAGWRRLLAHESRGFLVCRRDWTPDKDKWELYNLEEDWSQANDVAAKFPQKLAQLKELFIIEAAKNKVLPIGGALFVPMYHPELRLAPSYTRWGFYWRYGAHPGVLCAGARQQAQHSQHRYGTPH